MFKEIQDWIVLFFIRRRGFVTGLKTILHCFKKSIKRKTKTNPRLFPARVFPRFRQCACCMLLWGGHGGLRCCGVDSFFWCGIVVKNNWYRGVAMISKLTVYDVCSFKPTVFGEINHFWCCSLSFNDDHGKAWYSPWVYMPTTVIAKPMNDSGPPGSLWDEAQLVDIIVDHIDRQTINLAAIVLVPTMTNCIKFFMK